MTMTMKMKMTVTQSKDVDEEKGKKYAAMTGSQGQSGSDPTLQEMLVR